MNITLENLADVGVKPSLRQHVMDCANNSLPQFHVDTKLRVAHFMAQVCHESNCFTVGTENMNYTNPHRLMLIWPKRFTSLNLAQQYVNNPQKLANFVYANRMGNGAPETGDGFKYRGRGPIQTTGKSSYRQVSQKIFGDDRLLDNPDLLTDLNFGLQAALIEWDEGNCNELADADNIIKITKFINGGLIGLESRKENLAEWKHTLGVN